MWSRSMNSMRGARREGTKGMDCGESSSDQFSVVSIQQTIPQARF
jgi:hypothetical protein